MAEPGQLALRPLVHLLPRSQAFPVEMLLARVSQPVPVHIPGMEMPAPLESNTHEAAEGSH